jgi:hypothetical protein
VAGLRLRAEPPLSEATVLVRGGPDTPDKLARHARRTARAWSLDGQPLLGISVFAVLDIPLDELLSARFATYRLIYVPPAARLLDRGFDCCRPGCARTTPFASAEPIPQSSASCWPRSGQRLLMFSTLGARSGERGGRHVPRRHHR